MAQSQPLLNAVPLFVELSGARLRHVLELEPAADRVFVVGSSRQADVPIEVPGVAAIEFHLERAHDEVWLTPAYRGRGLTINGKVVREPVHISTGLVVQLGDYELSLKPFTDQDDAAPATRSSSAPRPLPGDYSLCLPTETEPTSVAIPPVGVEITAPIAAAVAPKFALPPQKTERMSLVVPLPPLAAQQTQRLAPAGMLPPPSEAQFQTVRMEPVRIPPRPLIRTTPSSTEPASSSSLATQDTTAFDVAALPAAVESLHAEATPPIQPIPCAASSATAPTPVARCKGVSHFNTLLEQLGLAAKQRPVLVFGAATAVALVLALALVGASRFSNAHASTQSHGASPRASAMPAIAARPPAQASATPSVLVASAITPEKPAATGRDAARIDSPLVIVARHLSAGRFAEAAEQYRALGSTTDGAVYAELAVLLSRRLSPLCDSNPAARDNACPEMLK